MNTDAPVVIVGASVAGVRTAQSLRRLMPDQTIVLIDPDRDAPYDKPPLSKEYLKIGSESVKLDLIGPEGLDVELRTGVAAVGLDAVAQLVQLCDGSTIPYSTVVIATGSAPRPFPWRGDGTIRTLEDAERVRAALDAGGPLVVVGAGVIGMEVAATARSRNVDVTVVDVMPTPLLRMAGEHVGGIVRAAHESHGVTFALGSSVAEVSGGPGEWQVVLDDDRVLEAAVLLVGTGVSPKTEWLQDSQILLDDGVLCDDYCRAITDEAPTGLPSVYAVGDVSRPRRDGVHQRLENWTNAAEQAAVVAHNIADPASRRTYQPVEYCWSDQYDLQLQVVGRPVGAPARSLSEGDRTAVVYENSGIVSAVVTLRWPRAAMAARRALIKKTAVDEFVESKVFQNSTYAEAATLRS
ncbi:NAD(P)/FAD-dependent oxidoreductase [Rhodococcus sp. NPDC019627]|uniref:NAD(P)/FAD-dependent oxidoreductase n=1 Tax=unclassified Rhodococcus (in: high G+C Gram-positive bacteria) TaxID=192944 RepID=UPI0033FC2C24